MAGAARGSKTHRGMQDGMLAWYKSQAALSDASIEHKVDSEPFDYREMMGDYAAAIRKLVIQQEDPKQ